VKRQTIADSVLIALVAAAVSLGSVGLLFSRHVPLPDDLAYLGIGRCGAPSVAIVNIVFIVRDHRNGREEAAARRGALDRISIRGHVASATRGLDSAAKAAAAEQGVCSGPGVLSGS
jgi:hypothetical protein